KRPFLLSRLSCADGILLSLTNGIIFNEIKIIDWWRLNLLICCVSCFFFFLLKQILKESEESLFLSFRLIICGCILSALLYLREPYIRQNQSIPKIPHIVVLLDIVSYIL